jgi:hypothetical protein
MNTRSLFLLFALTAPMMAQDFAPDSVGNTIVEISPTAGASALPFSQYLTSDGVAYVVVADDGPLVRPIGYFWTKTGPKTGTLGLFSGLSIGVTLVTFTASGRGTYQDSLGSGSIIFRPLLFAPKETNIPLRNVSARVLVGPAQPAQVGFVIGGSLPRRVLVRAVGPTLAQFGVSTPVASPQLVLSKGRTQVATNNAWGGSPSLASTFAYAGAFPLPTASRDSALLLALGPGSYSALVQSGTVGELLLEVYILDAP